MKRLILIAVVCAFMAGPAGADLAPVGPPVFYSSISQTFTYGSLAPKWAGMRVVAPSDFNGAYIEGMAGVGALVTGVYQPRDDFSHGSVSQLVEGWWEVNGDSSTVTFEIADPATFPSSNAADYVGLTVQSVLARADKSYRASREWIYTDGAAPGGTPTGGGSWEKWETTGWYISPIHYDGSAWSGSPVPVPGAVLLGILGLGAVGVKLRRFT